MPTLHDVLSALERIAPVELAFDWDNVGLQVGDPDAKIRRVLLTLDPSRSAVREATQTGAELLLTHHPLLFAPLKRLQTSHGTGATIAAAIRDDIAIAAAHTNWDHAENGLNDALARTIGLQDVIPFGQGPEIALATLVVYTPKGTEEDVIEAVCEAGAGAIGNYRRCAFVSHGHGTFEPVEGAHPAIGMVGRRETVEEARVKVVIPLSKRAAIIAAMRAAHPYEEVAHSVLPIAGGLNRPAGRIGTLPRPLDRAAFLAHLGTCLSEGETNTWGPEKTIQRVAVVGGAADSEWSDALAAGADAFVTGEVKHHNALAATEAGLLIIAAGHYATENPGMAHLATRLAGELPEIVWTSSSPGAGDSGRPW